jgi:hypothetical protein
VALSEQQMPSNRPYKQQQKSGDTTIPNLSALGTNTPEIIRQIRHYTYNEKDLSQSQDIYNV